MGNSSEAKKTNQNRKTGMHRIAAVILAAVFVWASVGTAIAAESRTKINSVSLTVHSSIQAGSSSGNVSVTADEKDDEGSRQYKNDHERGR